MRPPGDVRTALRRGFAELAAREGPVEWVAVVPLLEPMGISRRSMADMRMVRKTVSNMVQAGELVRAGCQKAAGGRVYRALFEPAELLAPAGPSLRQGLDVESVVQGWGYGQ